MRTAWIEKSLFKTHLPDKLKFPKDYADRVVIDLPGERFQEKTGLWISPRMLGFERGEFARSGQNHSVLLLEVMCVAKVSPKGAFGRLSTLVDSVRDVIDKSQPPAAPAAKIMDDKNRIVGICDFGAAQETRSHGTSVSIGGVTVPGVDLAVLTVRCQLSPIDPPVPQP